MAGLPENFKSISPVIGSYDFVDIASGTGYIVLYAGSTVDLKILSNKTFKSNATFTEATAGAANSNYEKLIDYDFDLVLNRPLDLKGLGIVTVPHAIDASNDDSYIVATLIKYDGSETTIVTNQGSVISSVASMVYFTSAIDLNISTPRHLKIGETLRLTIEVWARSSSGAARVRLGHDPESRTSVSGLSAWAGGTDYPTELKLLLPVRLNL